MMYLQQTLTSVALLRLAVALQPAQPLTPRQVPTGPCSTGVHVIAAGGAGTANPFEYGLLGSLAESIVAAIPDSTRVSLPYDKLTTRTNPNAVPDGVTTLTQYVNDYNAACPNTKQILIGYSSGAVITMNGICNGPVRADNNIIATIVYGDQTRQTSQPYNRGTCTAGSGRNPRTPGTCGAFTPNIRSYCNVADVECCSGGDPQEHFVYPAQYDDDATQFVLERFEATGGPSTPQEEIEEEPTVAASTSSPASTPTPAPVQETETPSPSSEPTVPAPSSAPASTTAAAPVVQTPTSVPAPIPEAPTPSPQRMTDSMAQILLKAASDAGYVDGCASMSGAMQKLLLNEAERAGFVEAC